MRELKQSFLEVTTENGTAFGGNQAWFGYKFMKKSGCGVISAANLLLYMKGKRHVTEEEYVDFAKRIWRQYLPVIPGFGMNGLTLMAGLNRYFHKHEIPLKAFWGISGKKMLSRIDEMLRKDLPVILSVGPNFPMILGKEKLNFN